MKIKIVCIGSVREEFYKKAVSEYLKRCSRFSDIEIIELKEYKTNNEEKDKKLIIENETRSIVDYLTKEFKNKGGVYNVILDVKGTAMSSVKFSEILKEENIKYLNFIIGGSLGIGDPINPYKKLSLSFSKMTFPHQLMRVILLEQLFRSFKILSNESYHK